MTSRALRTVALGTLSLATAGCQLYERHRPGFWPFPERELTTYNTPALRVDAISDFAMRSKHVDSPDQRQITDQLARQIQVEPDPLVRQAVIKAIAEFRTPMAEQVLQAGLQDESEAVRIECCQAIGRRADAGAVEALAVALKSDSNVDVKMAAAEALGKIKTPEATRALAAALDDRDPAMQYVGVQSLKSITGRDYGPNVDAWRQVAAGNPPAEPPVSVAERIKRLTPLK